MKLTKEETGLLYFIVAEAIEKLSLNSNAHRQLVEILYKLDVEARK